jgi:RNA polymerase sigma-54 factor
MAMEMKLQVKLSQTLVMTPQLVQAIRLLQLSHQEISEEIVRELDSNRVLADAESGGGEPSGDDERRQPADKLLADAQRKSKDVDMERFLENRYQQGPGRSGSEELPPPEQTHSRPTTLRDHLAWQLQMSDLEGVERDLGEMIIGNVDERGYLDLSGGMRPDGTMLPDFTIDDFANDVGLPPGDDSPLRTAEEVLDVVQHFDPLGVAARNQRECLLLQAEARDYSPREIAIIRDHFDHLRKRNFKAIAKVPELQMDLEAVQDAVEHISKLELEPGRAWAEEAVPIVPDVFVVKRDGEYVVADDDRGFYIDRDVLERLQNDPKGKEIASDRLKSAQWLLRAIEQRRRTVIKVTQCIVEKQQKFFELGVEHLKPMILRDIAEEVEMHESTISRVTSNKYVHTPQGLFELKYFFNSSISRVNGDGRGEDDVASESVKQAIKKLVSAEDKSNPLSDQALVKMLDEGSGIKIARRTVAKYREMLGIMSSSKRRKVF